MTIETLLSHIEREHELLQSLGELLERESLAIRGRDFATLDEIALQKSQLLSELDTHSAERKSLESAISEHHPRLQQARARRDDLVSSLRQNNLENGAAINASARFTQRALDILLSTGPRESIYGANGRPRKHSSSRYSTSV